MHNTYRVCDTVYCKKCGKSWDISDDAPPCTNIGNGYLRMLRRGA